MLQSKIENILEEIVIGNEKMEKLNSRFHAVEREIDDMANKPEADLNEILRRAKEVIKRVFESDYNFFAGNWSKIEDEIEKNLKELKN